MPPVLTPGSIESLGLSSGSVTTVELADGTVQLVDLGFDPATQAELDAKVTDAIADGVTTIAPSQNAVFDALALKDTTLTVTAVKSADYTLAAGEFAPFDISAANRVATLPTAPANGTLCGVKITTTDASFSKTLTVNSGGSDTINAAATTSWSGSSGGRVMIFQYVTAQTRWYTVEEGVVPSGTPISKFATATANLAMGGFIITGEGDPSAALHVMNKQYADAHYSPIASPTFTGITTAPEFSASGLTGATTASRYVGATTGGAPVTGTFAVNDWVITPSGVYVCVTAGSPGTWQPAGSNFELGRDETTASETRTGSTAAVVLADPCKTSFVCPSGYFMVEAWAYSGAVNAVGGRGSIFIVCNTGPQTVAQATAISTASGDIDQLYCRWGGTAAKLGISVGATVEFEIQKKVYVSGNTFTVVATTVAPITIRACTAT